MKLSILYLVAAVLMIVSCKKECKPDLNKKNQTSESVKIIHNNYIHPYFVKYKTYRRDLNTSFKNFITQKNNQGC